MTEQIFFYSSLFKSYDVVNLTRWPKLVQRLYLSQSLINQNETWYTSSTPYSECPCQRWEQRSELAKMHYFAYNFWKHSPNVVISVSFNSLGYADSDDVSFVIFHECACQPYWSKWKIVFSLLLIQTLSSFIQNLIIWSLDRPARKWLNRFLIFTTVPEKYLSEVGRTCVCCLMLVILAFY